MKALSSILISGAPEQPVFNTDRLHDPTSNLQDASQHRQFCALQNGAVSPIRTSLLLAPCCERYCNANLGPAR
jgi:hypothetical protein